MTGDIVQVWGSRVIMQMGSAHIFIYMRTNRMATCVALGICSVPHPRVASRRFHLVLFTHSLGMDIVYPYIFQSLRNGNEYNQNTHKDRHSIRQLFVEMSEDRSARIGDKR